MKSVAVSCGSLGYFHDLFFGNLHHSQLPQSYRPVSYTHLMVVDDDDDVMLINSNGIIIRMQAKEISRLGRATQGVKIMNVADDVNIIALAKVAREDELEKEIEGGSESGEQLELK